MLLWPRPASRARCAALMFIFCHATKNEPRKRAKGCRLWKPLPCHTTWIKTRFDSTPKGCSSHVANTRGRQRKQKNLLPVLLKICAITGRVADGKSSCESALRAPSMLAFFHQNANASSEYLTLRANMSEAVAQRQFARCGIPKGIRPFG